MKIHIELIEALYTNHEATEIFDLLQILNSIGKHRMEAINFAISLAFEKGFGVCTASIHQQKLYITFRGEVDGEDVIEERFFVL